MQYTVYDQIRQENGSPMILAICDELAVARTYRSPDKNGTRIYQGGICVELRADPETGRGESWVSDSSPAVVPSTAALPASAVTRSHIERYIKFAALELGQECCDEYVAELEAYLRAYRVDWRTATYPSNALLPPDPDLPRP